MKARVALANAAENVQSRRKGYWQTYEEGKREYPAEVFPKAMYGYDDSFQARKVYPQCGWQSRETGENCRKRRSSRRRAVPLAEVGTRA